MHIVKGDLKSQICHSLSTSQQEEENMTSCVIYYVHKIKIYQMLKRSTEKSFSQILMRRILCHEVNQKLNLYSIYITEPHGIVSDDILQYKQRASQRGNIIKLIVDNMWWSGYSNDKFYIIEKFYLSAKFCMAIVWQCSEHDLLKCVPEVQGDS